MAHAQMDSASVTSVGKEKIAGQVSHITYTFMQGKIFINRPLWFMSYPKRSSYFVISFREENLVECLQEICLS